MLNSKDEEILRCKQEIFRVESSRKELELKMMRLGINDGFGLNMTNNF